MAEKIKVYGTGWCPDTARSKRLLARLGIVYDWLDVEHDDAACAELLKINEGKKTFPTIIFPDGSIMREPHDEELEKKCNKLRAKS